LCCLEGHTLEETAQHLGWGLGSVKGRLERGRARLHRNLLRRGLALSAVLAAAEVARAVEPMAPTTQLIALVQTGLAFGGGNQAAVGTVTPHVALLAKKTVQSMMICKLKVGGILALSTCVLAVAGGAVA